MPRIRFAILTCLIALFVLSGPPLRVYAQITTPLESGVRASGMGGVWIALPANVEATAGNPALLGTFDHASLSAGMLRMRGDYKGSSASIYTSPTKLNFGTSWREKDQGIGVVLPLSQGRIGLVAGVLWQQYYTSENAFLDEDIHGQPEHLTPAAALTLGGWLSFGASTSRFTGKLRNETSSPTETIRYSGEAYHWGIRANLEETKLRFPVTLGISYTPAWELKGENDIEANHTLYTTQPERLSAGVSLELWKGLIIAGDLERNKIDGDLLREVVATPDSLFVEDEDFTVHFRTHLNELAWRAGLEYRVQYSPLIVTFRAGVFDVPNPNGDLVLQIEQTPLPALKITYSSTRVSGRTLGLGVGLGPLEFNLAWVVMTYPSSFGSFYGAYQLDNRVLYVLSGVTLQL